MRFYITSSAQKNIDSVLVYRSGEYSFDVARAPAGFTSILVNDLSLEVDRNGKLVSVWGLCPHPGWKHTKLAPPIEDIRDVFVFTHEPLERGISQRLNTDERWPIFADREEGWVCIKSNQTGTTFAAVMKGVILELDSAGKLCALWLKPEVFPAGV